MSESITGVGSSTNSPSFCSKEKKESSILKGTLIAAGAGAIVSGGISSGLQLALIKSDTFKNNMLKKVDNLKSATIMSTRFEVKDCKIFAPTAQNIERVNNSLASLDKIRDAINLRNSTKKIDWAIVGKAAAKRAAIVGGIYLLYKGVCALFSKKD